MTSDILITTITTSSSTQKRIIFGIVDKIMSIVYSRFYLKNIKEMIDILLKNCYPLNFIFKIINKRLQFYMYHKKTTKVEMT